MRAEVADSFEIIQNKYTECGKNVSFLSVKPVGALKHWAFKG